MVQSLAEAAANCTRNITAGIEPVLAPSGTGRLEASGSREDRVVGLIYDLKNGDCSRRVAAICALAELGKEAADAVPHLIEAVEDSDWVVRVAAVTALGELGSAARPAVPALIEAIEKDDICVSAAIALGRIGPAASAAIEPLKRLRKRKQGFDHWCADEALRAIQKR
ncbi:MAG TPA: HEAT repeat domain-containing protein [Planctomycetota bacterium]|nr:HEAT repeat domain-containing protein [Planctomycetota bacterium]